MFSILGIALPPPKICSYRRKGNAVLAIVIVLAVVASLLGWSVTKATQVSMNGLGSSKIAMQAQHYANSRAELVEAEKYSDLASKNKSLISNTNFYEEVIVSSETTYPSNDKIKQKQCTVNVYYDNETIPRSSLKFYRYSVSDGASVPTGTILPWYGKLAEIPDGFTLCDGTNGTPDLRNRFLVGAGDQYKLSDMGGEDKHTLTIDEMPKHNHQTCSLFAEVGFDVTNGGGEDSGSGKRRLAMGDNTPFGYTNYWPAITGYRGSDQPHENRPPYYAVYYIMKL